MKTADCKQSDLTAEIGVKITVSAFGSYFHKAIENAANDERSFEKLLISQIYLTKFSQLFVLPSNWIRIYYPMIFSQTVNRPVAEVVSYSLPFN